MTSGSRHAPDPACASSNARQVRQRIGSASAVDHLRNPMACREDRVGPFDDCHTRSWRTGGLEGFVHHTHARARPFHELVGAVGHA